MLSIDEAIAHAREVAEYKRKCNENSDCIDIGCERCAEEHEQLAEWLEELKEYQSTRLTPQMIEDLKKSEKQAHKIAIQNAMIAEDSYNKAIDDCLNIAKFYKDEWDGICHAIERIEQLKEHK